MMIFATYLNFLYSSILFYLVSKIVCVVVSYQRSMHYKRSSALSSIPENEGEEKWVPKKKHEVLKAKYKCLKKLFQIYDASVIGMLPQEAYAAGDTSVVEDSDDVGRKRKRKRSHRVRLDACAGTSDHEIQTAVQVECSKTNTSDTESCTKAPSTKVYAATQASRESLLASEHDCGCVKSSNVLFQPSQVSPCCPRPRMSRPRKRTRFQSFVQRILGLRSPTRHHCQLDAAVSECDVRMERRRRRIRFRRARRPTRAQSEGAMRTPAHACAQSVQRNCLLDTTPRQCPIAGCRMMLYGIINYNDHLNLCHFPGRRYVCHFCHEGFECDGDKMQHESEHIGLRTSVPSSPPPTSRSGITCVTQTDPEPSKEHDEKLKKIVSFFDKIVDSTQILTESRKSRHSEMHLPNCKTPTDAQTIVSASDGHSKVTSSCSDFTGKRLTYSCNDVRRRNNYRRSLGSDAMSQCCSDNCNFCGENFDYSQALERKFGEFHSCGALPSRRRTETHVTSTVASSVNLDQASIASSVVNCNGVLSFTDHFEDAKPTHKPSTSVVFSASECSRKVSTRSLADRFKSYKWEPCTRIIRV
ncbi:uncharacterized protein LOC125238803 [Leguminivora glycinivorella]|uniref:uncharacterized protein LOC125238803 n=1 Tax=Leguminivora glycinivorella TaxID=1035111 RepID=UPI00200DDF95|nr:uncharacterized protein LOC125238803 [Leguminivora glycinivorella]